MKCVKMSVKVMVPDRVDREDVIEYVKKKVMTPPVKDSKDWKDNLDRSRVKVG